MYLLLVLLDLQETKFPRTLPDLKQLHDNFITKPKNLTFLFFCYFYIYEVTFSIPGCMILNIIAGNFYGLLKGWTVTCILTAVGGTFSYIISKHTVCNFLESIFTKHVKKLRKEYQRKSIGHLSNISYAHSNPDLPVTNTNINTKTATTYYDPLAAHAKSISDRFFIISIRMMPIMPAGIVNLVCPILKIRPIDFFIGSLFGTMPYNFILVNVGTTLKNLTSLDDIFNLKNMSLLLSMSAVMMFVWCYKNSLGRVTGRSSAGWNSSFLNYGSKSNYHHSKNHSNSRLRSSTLPMESVTNSFGGKTTIV